MDNQKPQIEHFFVLMLENRSYDNIFGYSDFKGNDPRDIHPAAANNVTANDLSTMGSLRLPTNAGNKLVEKGAPYQLKDDEGGDPGHEFIDTLIALCGETAYKQTTPDNIKDDIINLSDGVYPDFVPNPSEMGFALDYEAHDAKIPENVLKCFSPEQLPVLNQLAQEFIICDNWFSSMPGPTWPNRFFALCGSSGGLDHSPPGLRAGLASAAGIDGFEFDYGSIFDWLEDDWYVAHGEGDWAQAFAIKSIETKFASNFITREQLFKILSNTELDKKFIWIEPSYDVFFNFRRGNSMHPLGDVRKGETLIKEVYENIRNSEYWEKSVLLIVFDEHGGFFDHCLAPKAPPPGDRTLDPNNNKHGFKFDVFGLRVPAIIISPWVNSRGIDKTFYDHTSIAHTVSNLFKKHLGPNNMGSRVRQSISFDDLFTKFNLPKPRVVNSDAPKILKSPVTNYWGWLADLLPRSKPKTFTSSMAAFAPVSIRMHHARLKAKSSADAAAFLKKVKAIREPKDIHDILEKEIRVYNR
jgi:phospholipase C